MNNFNNNYNPYQNPYGYGQPMPGYMNQQLYMGPQFNVPTYMNALNNEEIEQIRNTKPISKINLSVDHTEYLRSLCTHRDNHTGLDVVQKINDGSDDVYCPICQKRWNPKPLDKDMVHELVKTFNDQIQNMKWVGNIPTEVVREYCAILPLVNKFPDLYEYAVNNFNKIRNGAEVQSGEDARIQSLYNTIINPYQQYGNYYGGMNMGMNPGMMYNTNQNMGQMGQTANPNINPMEYSYQPNGMPNQQMNGQYNPMGYQPTFNAVNGGMPNQQMNVEYNPIGYQSQQNQQQAQQQTTEQPKETKQETIKL